MADILIIGGGTAGLTAAIYAARAGKTVTLLEKESTGGQIVYSPRIENYPGLPGISGADYAAALTEQAESFGATIEYAQALSIDRDGAGDRDGFVVRCDTGDFTAKALIIAAGTSHRHLGVAGEEELTGRGVSYCAVCDGAFYAGGDVAVLGGGNTALTDALFLAGICSHVTVIHRRDVLRGEAALVERLRQRENVSFTLSARRMTDSPASSCGICDPAGRRCCPYPGCSSRSGRTRRRTSIAALSMRTNPAICVPVRTASRACPACSPPATAAQRPSASSRPPPPTAPQPLWPPAGTSTALRPEKY